MRSIIRAIVHFHSMAWHHYFEIDISPRGVIILL